MCIWCSRHFMILQCLWMYILSHLYHYRFLFDLGTARQFLTRLHFEWLAREYNSHTFAPCFVEFVGCAVHPICMFIRFMFDLLRQMLFPRLFVISMDVGCDISNAHVWYLSLSISWTRKVGGAQQYLLALRGIFRSHMPFWNNWFIILFIFWFHNDNDLNLEIWGFGNPLRITQTCSKRIGYNKNI